MKATNFGEERVDSTVQQVAFGAVEDFALSTGYFDNVRIWFNNKVILFIQTRSLVYEGWLKRDAFQRRLDLLEILRDEV